MQFNTYTSSGAHIAAALVNDPMTEAAEVGALLAGFDVEITDAAPARGVTATTGEVAWSHDLR
mgnify:CR=1 FL=1